MEYAFGKDVDFYPIYLSLISRTDYTKFFISSGNISTQCKYNEMLVYSVHDNRTQMYYNKSCDDDDDANAKKCVSKLPLTLLVKDKCLIRI